MNIIDDALDIVDKLLDLPTKISCRLFDQKTHIANAYSEEIEAKVAVNKQNLLSEHHSENFGVGIPAVVSVDIGEG